MYSERLNSESNPVYIQCAGHTLLNNKHLPIPSKPNLIYSMHYITVGNQWGNPILVLQARVRLEGHF